MLTCVIYSNGEGGLVRADLLDQLLQEGEIQQFLRIEGWSKVGVDPVRSDINRNNARERRQKYRAYNFPNYLYDLKFKI